MQSSPQYQVELANAGAIDAILSAMNASANPSYQYGAWDSTMVWPAAADACDALDFLTRRDVIVQAIAVQTGAIRQAAELMRRKPQDERIQRGCCSVLHNLANENATNRASVKE